MSGKIRAGVAIALVALAPMAWLANRAAARRDASAFTPNWTSVVLELEVVRKDVSPCIALGAPRLGGMNAARDGT